MAKTKIGLICSLMLLCMAACQSNPVTELRFSDAQTGERFLALDACIQEFTSEDDEWRTSGYQRLGDFFEGRWCRGAGTLTDCKIKSSRMEKRDQHIINLRTFFDSPEDTEVSGLGLSVLWVPAEAGWAMFLNYNEGEVMGVNFWYYESSHWDPDEELERVAVIGPFSYKVVETTVHAPETLSLSRSDKLAKVLESPEAMRDMAIHYYQALAAEVEVALHNGDISTCDYGEYQGDGIPPICTPRPFSADELAAELKHADEYFANQQVLLQEHYREIYTTLFQAFPFDHCQP